MNDLAALIMNLKTLVNDVGDETLSRVKDKTPVASGRLRDGWVLDKTDTAFQLSNDVPYAGYVEEGTTDNAPVGMLATTVLEIPDMIDQHLNKVR